MQGVVDVVPAEVRRVRCYCDDCQAFARHLGAVQAVDERGGTPIVQTSPAVVRFTAGLEHLACLKLRPGNMIRWYASCCRTPIANTVEDPRVPFVGLLTACLADAAVVDALPEVKLQGRFARGGTPPGAHPKVPLRVMVDTLLLGLRRWRRGDWRRTPFFDADRKPIRAPHLLTDAERADAYG